MSSKAAASVGKMLPRDRPLKSRSGPIGLGLGTASLAAESEVSCEVVDPPVCRLPRTLNAFRAGTITLERSHCRNTRNEGDICGGDVGQILRRWRVVMTPVEWLGQLLPVNRRGAGHRWRLTFELTLLVWLVFVIFFVLSSRVPKTRNQGWWRW